ncbi:DENN domain-containing protein 1A isoform X2 [Drosophila sulfurigaster albostrigata]|uniref:DENN domain-containing protein 1A isoform X2 n=1 Tax=Drosophila sulfurigaster albostrigata TaxID=89887 RepID=UPI002D21E7A0|nr:DENN domain-containing protein 1A isoform X2 [Drosophila sulfurigaster albostrigata]
MGSRIKNDVKKLFEFWCEVKPTRGIDRGTISRNGGGTATPAGVIIESFPEGFRDKEVLTGIPSFAFPCDIERGSVQSYSFVHTTGDSKWRFGFCRHDPKTDTAMVLITYLPWHDTFLKLLIVLAELRRTDRNGFRTFLSEAYNRGVPDSGGSLTVFYSSGQSHFTFERPLQFQLPSIPENHNLNLYYNFVDPKEMICVFAAMLAERRIIFTSSHLDRLSSCIQAANAFLYPMVWQHIFIPVLPWEFKDYLGAPMPYLIGVPKPVLDTVSDDELGEVVILNCDTKIFESPFDDVRSLPPEIVSQLKKYLSHTQDHIGDRVSKIFLGALVQLIGGYRDAVEFHDTCKTFNHAKFIESRPAHLRPFLTKMMELQIFAQFVDDRLKMLNSGLGFSDEFELETVRYAEKMKKRGRNYVFLKQMKDKTNPAVKSAVKSVKESSRGVKTAYKKWRDNGSHNPNHQFHFGLGSPQHSDRPDGSNGAAFGRKVTHRSAPSSPVCSKRLEGEISVNGGGGIATREQTSLQLHPAHGQPRRGPVSLAMSSSSSHIPANGSTLGASMRGNCDHLVGASPAVSSASSICSSEMNLSQELQNHPLFKTPAVDRSLKPNAEHHSTRSRIAAANTNGAPPARPPPPTTQPVSYYNHPYAPSNSTPSHVVVESKPPRHTSTPAKGRQLATTDSSFDNPPDMQSPPIPPRRQCSANAVVAATAAAVTAGINRLERNCWQDEQNDSLRCSNTSTGSASSSSASSSSCSSGASFVTAASRFSQLNMSSPNGSEPAPIPTPRAKRESPRSNSSAQPQPEDSMNDLISLDDSNNTSFDLEDFDPLNQNARPLPPLGSKHFNSNKTKSSTLPAGVTSSVVMQANNSVNNPLYPYFAPKHMATVAAVTNRVTPLPPQIQRNNMTGVKPDDDFELLRKYGLDQFSLNVTTTTTTPSNTTAPALTAGTGVGKGMNNWTTFD